VTLLQQQIYDIRSTTPQFKCAQLLAAQFTSGVLMQHRSQTSTTSMQLLPHLTIGVSSMDSCSRVTQDSMYPSMEGALWKPVKTSMQNPELQQCPQLPTSQAVRHECRAAHMAYAAAHKV
jgi:hypothetical protein